jgi:hypothetical protein
MEAPIENDGLASHLTKNRADNTHILFKFLSEPFQSLRHLLK